MSDNKLAAFVIACLSVLCIVGIVVGYSMCESQRDRRAECIKRSTAADCLVLFREGGGS